jgi:16S rRNA (guanine1516-N2)-methyltransferase
VGKLKFSGSFTEDEKQKLKSEFSLLKLDVGDLVLNRAVQPTELKSDRGFHLKYDFDNNRIDYNRSQIGKKEPLARALGIEKGVKNVLDLSMGLAVDSVFLSQLGFQVTSLERNGLLHFLALEGQKISSRPVVRSIQFLHSEALSYLQSHSLAPQISIYFDPMFPEKKKSALPRQEMQFFKKLVGADEDAAEVLKLAIEKNVNRVVVKRPVKAEPLWGKPSHQLKTKLVRYDVYMKQVILK